MLPTKIILVDDEEGFRLSTAELLRRNGFACDSFSDPDAAKTAMLTSKYQLVVSDLRMRGNMDMEFISDARKRNLPVIITTGFPCLESAMKSMHLGVKDYLVKPFEIGSLIESITDLTNQGLFKERFSPRSEIGAADLNLSQKLDAVEFMSDDLSLDFLAATDSLGLISMTDPAGRIIFSNDKFSEVSKYSREELIGKTHGLLNSEVHPKEFWRHMWKTVNAGLSWRADVCNRAKDGSLYWVDTYIYPICDAAGEVKRIASFRIDITPRKTLEAQAKAATDHLILASRSASVAQLAAGAAHEINNPLAIMVGQAYAVKKMIDNLQIIDEQRQVVHARLDKMIDSAMRVSSTITLLHGMASRGAETPAMPVFLTDVLTDTLSLSATRSAGRGMTIETSCEMDFPYRCKGPLLSQVLVNLITFCSSVVRLEEEGKKVLKITCRHVDEQLEIEVIAPFLNFCDEELRALRDPFFYRKFKLPEGVPFAFYATNIAMEAGAILMASSDPGGLCFKVLHQDVNVNA